MKRGGPLKRRTPLRAKRDRRWAKLRQQILDRDEGRCQYPHCVRAGSDVHHIAPRSVRPDLKYEEDNLVLLCREHHDIVGDMPVLAHALGLHAFSWEATQRSAVSGSDTGITQPERRTSGRTSTSAGGLWTGDDVHSVRHPETAEADEGEPS